jgi:PIN domain nuclease of toxin-antitoxin system
MNVLLDTHTALWWWEDSPELSREARNCLAHPDTEVFFSSVSGYEIFQKVRTGKLVIPPPLERDLAGQVRREGWRILPLGLEEAVQAARLESPHRDPFDRLLAAQSGYHALTMVTTDPFFRGAGVPTLW